MEDVWTTNDTKAAKGAKGVRAFRGFSLAWRKAVIQSTDGQIDALAYKRI